AKESASVAIGVDIDDSVLLQLGGVGFRPLRRTEQSRLFTIPEAINDGALRLPALLQHLGETASLLHFGNRARNRIVRTVHPAVMMVAANHPLVGILRAGNTRDYVVETLDIPVELKANMNSGRPGTDMVSDRQSAAPIVRRQGTLQGGKKRLRVGVGHR